MIEDPLAHVVRTHDKNANAFIAEDEKTMRSYTYLKYYKTGRRHHER